MAVLKPGVHVIFTILCVAVNDPSDLIDLMETWTNNPSIRIAGIEAYSMPASLITSGPIAEVPQAEFSLCGLVVLIQASSLTLLNGLDFNHFLPSFIVDK